MIQAMSNGNIIGSATGSFIKRGNDVYLVTNWHVLSGRKPFDNQPMHPMGALPDMIAISWLASDLQSGGVIEVDLNDADGNKRWLEHPDGSSVDAARPTRSDGYKQEGS